MIYPFIETEHQYDLGQNTYFYTFRNRDTKKDRFHDLSS
ncbi:hypothetical protein SSALIVM18_03146 [Streptococcus salivarius M18]|nr:hypothetical protein SSALIVM18_03146 [Streptococcus salivarius M18]